MSVTTFRTEPSVTVAPQAPTAVALPPRALDLRFPTLTTTVPKELVHRASVAEVLLTGWDRIDDTHFAVSGQWPRGHSFFSPVQDRHDPLIVAETFRQAAILLAHTEFGVELDQHFLMWDMNIDVRPEGLGIGSAPATVRLDVTCHDVTWRRGTLAGVRYEATFLRDGHPVATASGSCTCTSPAVYRRLRGGRLEEPGTPLPLSAPMAPQNVGRTSPMDVVLSPTERSGRWLLRSDTRHPVLFDHQGDHVPGMVLLEAARQAMVATLGQGASLRSLTSRFLRYVELDAPCVIEAAPLPDGAAGPQVLVEAHQNGESVLSATVTADVPRA
ncbi:MULTISPECIES: ScbA/BarX family gamma-butyrolactone biosynthesis protein [unclassified Streptomyces]|uniref:ScbA/BarX family gamma-butyrolactone biosynthesis protein n=1 Tax=unclassified Streptomyces TaxID=2593676 RepID=UPI003BB60324